MASNDFQLVDWKTSVEFTIPTKEDKENHPLFNPRTIVAFLNQNKIWRDKTLSDVPISTIDERYLFNILGWIEKNIDSINFTLDIAYELENHAVTVKTSKLYTKLRARYMKLAQTPKF